MSAETIATYANPDDVEPAVESLLDAHIPYQAIHVYGPDHIEVPVHRRAPVVASLIAGLVGGTLVGNAALLATWAFAPAFEATFGTRWFFAAAPLVGGLVGVVLALVHGGIHVEMPAHARRVPSDAFTVEVDDVDAANARDVLHATA